MSDMAFRVDYGELGKAEPTPQGGLRIPAHLTRSGVFAYEQPDGSVIREYRPDSEVFDEKSLATLRDAPVTDTHPPSHVHPGNFKKYSVGHSGEARKDGDKVSSELVVQDSSALKHVQEGGRRQVSCGYHCDVDNTPGVTPEGEQYDRVQKNIRYNHVAIVDDGRAGPEVRLRLDSKGNQRTEDKMIERIDGVSYEDGSEAHKAALIRRDAAETARATELQDLKSGLEKANARADAAEEKLKAAEAQLSPEMIDRSVRARAEVIEKAQTVLGKTFKVDGLSNEAIQRAAVEKSFPGLKLDSDDGKPREDYISGLFAAVSSQSRADSLSASPPTIRAKIPAELATPPEKLSGKTLAQLRADRDGDGDYDDRSKKPLAVNKKNLMGVQASMLEQMK